MGVYFKYKKSLTLIGQKVAMALSAALVIYWSIFPSGSGQNAGAFATYG